jgi:UDP-glucose:tetrahydrobiopterin glucosyltransferase
MKLLFVSTSVAALGSGLGGGVELSLQNIANEMLRRGHQLQIVAPEGSKLNSAIPIIQIPGTLQTTAVDRARTAPIVLPDDSVLANMWDYAHQVQANYDLIVNFAYDWLPFYLTPFFTTPIAHRVSMSSLSDAMDRIIGCVAEKFPNSVAFLTHSQAKTFSFNQGGNLPITCLSSAIDLSLYQFSSQPQPWLAWLGRIAPEKGLEDAVAAAQILNVPLKIVGKIQEQSYWEQICKDYPDAPVDYLGFLSTQELQKLLGQSRAMLMTPRWVEAFGVVVIEALACGTPVISYRCGGPAEVIEDGKTGFLVEQNSIDGLVTAIARLDEIDRRTCRQVTENQYSLAALGDRIEQWFHNRVWGGSRV